MKFLALNVNNYCSYSPFLVVVYMENSIKALKGKN